MSASSPTKRPRADSTDDGGESSAPAAKRVHKTTIEDLPTPAFVVDREIVRRNCTKIVDGLEKFGGAVSLRPHVKTHKTIEGAKMSVEGLGYEKIVVSTLSEARFFSNSFSDILFAHPIDAKKIGRCAELTASVDKFHILIDSRAGLDAVLSMPHVRFSAYADVDPGYGRTGINPGADSALELVRDIAAATDFQGIYSHEGHLYACRSVDELVEGTKAALDVVNNFYALLMSAGIECPVVAVGSTPLATGFLALDKSEIGAVNELHPGNYVFYDLMQQRISACTEEEIACVVVASILAVYPERQQFLIDAGALAMSKDLGAGDTGFGVIRGHPDLIVTSVSQELGKVVRKDGGPIDFDTFKPGTTVAVYPNHSCLTSACHETYYVVDSSRGEEGAGVVVETWSPDRGW